MCLWLHVFAFGSVLVCPQLGSGSTRTRPISLSAREYHICDQTRYRLYLLILGHQIRVPTDRLKHPLYMNSNFSLEPKAEAIRTTVVRRADKNPYPHDRRANKDSYSPDRNVTDHLCSLIKLWFGFIMVNFST